MHMTRRQFMATTAARRWLSQPRMFLHAQAGGKLSIGFWDHWVPGANDATEELSRRGPRRRRSKSQIDFITSQGNKILLTIAAEAQAKSGHDILALPTWQPAEHAATSSRSTTSWPI